MFNQIEINKQLSGFRWKILDSKVNFKKKFKFLEIIIYSIIYAPVAQLDRALGYGPGGSGFNS